MSPVSPSCPSEAAKARPAPAYGKPARGQYGTCRQGVARPWCQSRKPQRIMPDLLQVSGGSQDYVGDPRNEDVLVSVNGVLTPRAEAKGSGVRPGLVPRDGGWEGLGLAGGRNGFFFTPSRPPVGRGENVKDRH